MVAKGAYRARAGCLMAPLFLWARFKAGSWPSGPELLAQDAFLEAVTGIEQHPHRNRLVGQHLDAADVAHVVMIGGGRNRTLFVLEHLDHHEGGVGEQGTAPPPGPDRKSVV